MAKPFTFGVQVSAAISSGDWRDLARRIEDHGYSTLYMPDHFVDTRLAPLPAMAIATAHTTALRVCALVFGNDYKHPAVLAKEIATIDVLSDGRVALGIGAGWMKSDYDALGLPYDRPGVRIERLEEAIRVVKGCWARHDVPFTFHGTHYTITDYVASPDPVQGRIPILVGGGGPKVLRLAGREADIVGINPNMRAGAVTDDAVKSSLADQTRQKIEWVREGAGDRFDALELQIRYFLAAVTDDARRLAEAVAPGFGITPDDALASGVALVGTVPEILDLLEQRREEWGVTNVVVGTEQIESFAPIVAQLAGR
jgi:probable F420-dependent oxidoreductase